MRKTFITLLCVVCVFAASAQTTPRYMRVTKTDGSITEFAVEAIDSIDFYTKIYTMPDTPIDMVNHTINGHEYVDLGLPSGLLWATCNVGATAPEEWGYYFAWGESIRNKGFNLDTYKWYTVDTIVNVDADGFEMITYERKYTKYNTKSDYGPIDNKTVLDLEDDAAYVNWGGNWRMPTYEEFEELINKCTWTWVTLNGIDGRKVVGPNGKYIFLPESSLTYSGRGTYWSSSLNTNNPGFAYNFLFNSSGFGWYDTSRTSGHTVRAVCSPK